MFVIFYYHENTPIIVNSYENIEISYLNKLIN